MDNDNNEIAVADETLVKTIDGIHYLLTAQELSEYNSRNSSSNVNKLALANLRQKRNKLISVCDWTTSTDSPLSEALINEWKIYRQALRDLPQKYTDNAVDVAWPSKPE